MEVVEVGELLENAVAKLERRRAQLGIGIEAGVDGVREPLREVGADETQRRHGLADPPGGLGGRRAGDRVEPAQHS